MKKHIICVFTLLLVLLFSGNKSLSESTPSTILLGELQHFDLQSPVIIPFDDTGEVIKQMRENDCDKGIVLFFDSNKPVEVQPTINNLGFDPRVIIDIEARMSATEFNLVTRNPLTMQKLDPRTDMFGIFFQFDPSEGGVTEHAVFDAVFSVKSNCFSPTIGMSMSDMVDNSLPPAFLQDSMPGLILNENAYSLRIGYAIGSEGGARAAVNLEHLRSFSVDTFSTSRAIDHLRLSLLELERVNSMLQDSTIMVGMTLIQTKLNECIEKDNEAIMLLDEIKDRTPSFELLADGEFTTRVVAAQELISEAIRCKKMVQGKLHRVEPRVGTE